MVGENSGLKVLTIDGVRRAVHKLGDSTVYTYLGFPYSGQFKGGLDFHGTRFTPQTDLGWVKNRPFPYYWEHARGELGAQIIGEAYVGDETPEGRLIDVIINRANQYHDLLAELDDLDLLRGSGQALSTCYHVNPETNEIELFHLGEYSGTVAPSNNLAKPIQRNELIVVRNIFNKYGLLGDVMANRVSRSGEAAAPAATTVAEAPAVEVAQEVAATESSASHVEGLESIFNRAVEAEEEEQEVARNAEVASIAEMLRSIQEQQAQILSELATLRTATAAIQDGQVLTANNIVRFATMGAGERETLTRSAVRQQTNAVSTQRVNSSGIVNPLTGAR